MPDDFDAKAAWERIERRMRITLAHSTARCLPPVEESPLFKVTDEDREQYGYEVNERMSIYVYEGMPERCISKEVNPRCCAHHLVLLELGMVDFWKYQCERPFARGMVRASHNNVIDTFCSRCESVGHAVEVCPFGLGDSDVMKVARLRRERHAGREAAA
jgi:hypothetical protein